MSLEFSPPTAKAESLIIVKGGKSIDFLKQRKSTDVELVQKRVPRYRNQPQSYLIMQQA